jgi:phytoene dehydrogenase-like protein
MNSDVVIIGGGVAGLASGALLAKQGFRVTVLEKGNQAGGRAYTYIDKGFTLNYGPHAMYRPHSGLLGDVMRRLGRPPVPYGTPDPLRSYWSDGDRFGSIGAKAHHVLTTRLFPVAGRLQVVKLMLAIRGAHPEKAADQTFGAWLDAHVGDEAVRRFGRALATINTYHHPADDLSAAFVLRHLQRNLFAKDYVGYLNGGWSTMYGVFIEELRAGGGELVTGTHVERLEVDGGRIVAAIAAGARYEAEAFVCTLPPQDAPAIAAPGSPLAAEMARWSSMQDVRALCMDLGFSRRLRDDLSLVFDVEHALYYSLHSEVTPDLAPTGSQLLHAMAYLSPEEAADAALMERRRHELIGGLDRFFPGWRDALVVERTLPGARVASEQQGTARVPLRSSTHGNLYYAGDARDLPYSLAEIALASALEAARAVGLAISGRRAQPPRVPSAA